MIIIALALFSASPSFPAQTPTPADLILKSGRVYTDHYTGRGWSQAMSIRGGTILSIGTDSSVERDRGPSTKVIDLRGRVALPGFNDAHAHFLQGGLALSRVDLSGTSSISQVQDRLRSYAAENPLKRWILGQGMDHTAFPGRKYPDRQELDKAIPDRPVLLWHTARHMMVLNTKALEQLKITAKTPNPPNGEIQKDLYGNPTGVLLDEAALDVERRVDHPSGEEIRIAFKRAQDEALRNGVTSIQGGPIRGEEEVAAIDELFASKQLSVRLSLWGDLEKPKEFLALREKYRHLPGEWVRLDAVKGFVDGVLSARTAALFDRYADDPKTRGEAMYTQEKLNALVLDANRAGIPVALHAIGDRAVAMSVTAIGAAKRQLFNSRIRNRLEHLEVVPPYVYPKIVEYGITVSAQPSHMTYENEEQSLNDARLGPTRSKHAFAWRGFLTSRAHLAFGTDWPVMPLNPMIGLFSAVHRQHFNGKPARGWQPQQKITLDQAIEAYTLGSAHATREDHLKGTLREGKFADVVVLDRDPFSVKALDLLKIKVSMTIVGGRIVHDASLPAIKAGPQ